MPTLVELQAALIPQDRRAREHCRVGVWLDGLPTDEAVVLERAIRDTEVSVPQIMDVVADQYGERMAETTLRKHRRGKCVCFSTGDR